MPESIGDMVPPHTPPLESSPDSGASSSQTSQSSAGPRSERSQDIDSARPGIPEALLKRINRYSGRLATDAVIALKGELEFFAELSADQRSEIQMIIQSAVRDFVAWTRNPEAPLTDTIAGFKLLPEGLGQGLSLQQTVQIVRAAMEFFEEVMPRVTHIETQRTAMVAAVLRFGRELGFTAAAVYAATAENRGSWDTRMEAMIVDAVVRGDAGAGLPSRASAVNWDPTASATVIVGQPHPMLGLTAVTEVHAAAKKNGRHILAVVQGSRLVAILSGTVQEPTDIPSDVLAAFSDGPVVYGHTVGSLLLAPASATEALSGLAAVLGRPGAPRPLAASELLPERILAGDDIAASLLLDNVVTPLREAGAAFEETLQAYLDSGGHVEACARALFVHPNTVRYRLKRVGEITHMDPLHPRDSYVLRIAMTLGKLPNQGRL